MDQLCVQEIQALIRTIISINATLFTVSFAAFAFLMGRWDKTSQKLAQELEKEPPNSLRKVKEFNKRLFIHLIPLNFSYIILYCLPVVVVGQVFLYVNRVLPDQVLLYVFVVVFLIAAWAIARTVHSE